MKAHGTALIRSSGPPPFAQFAQAGEHADGKQQRAARGKLQAG